MPNKNMEKGRSLEKSVRIIQEKMLESDPQLQGAPFSIESNKIIVVEGVRYEVDVLVKTLPDSSYESMSIFECKNWKKPVGKNDIALLADKVNALGANRGWLVARDITKDAEARLKQDSRLGFIRCTDDFLSPFSDMLLIHSVRDPLPIGVRLKERGVPPKENPDVFDWKRCSVQLNGRAIALVELVREQFGYIINDDSKDRAPYYQHEGTHWFERAQRIDFEPNELIIDGWEVETMVLVVRGFITIRRRKILSKFELAAQGRVFTFEPLNDVLPGKSLEVSFVQRL